jgi:membrane-associated phospholipid phosphatase
MRSADRGRAIRRALWTAGVTALLLLVLAGFVFIRQLDLYRADQSAVLRVHSAAGVLVPAAQWISTVGGPIGVDIGAGIVAVILLCRRELVPAVAVGAARLLELGAETVMKVVVGRPRPVLADPVATASGLSFPSGHAAGAAVLGVSVLVLVAPWITGARKALTIGCVVLTVLAIGASRVVLGVHNPSDVVGGFLLGIACGSVAAPWLLRVRAQPSPADHIGST